MVQVATGAQHSDPPKKRSLLTCEEGEELVGSSLVDIMRHRRVVETDRISRSLPSSWGVNDGRDLVQNQTEAEDCYSSGIPRASLTKESSWARNEIEDIIQMQMLEIEKQTHFAGSQNTTGLHKNSSWGLMEIEAIWESQLMAEKQGTEASDSQYNAVTCPKGFTRESSWGFNDISDIVENMIIQEDVKIPKTQISRIVRPTRSGRKVALIRESSWGRHDISGVLER